MTTTATRPTSNAAPVTAHAGEVHRDAPTAGLRGALVWFVLLGVVTTACVQSGPLLVALVIDHLLDDRAVAIATTAAIAYLVLNAVGAGVAIVQMRIASRMVERFLDRLRTRVFTHVLGLDATFFERTTDGALLSRLTHDVEIVAMFLRTSLVPVLGNLLVLVVTTVYLFVLSPLLALVVLVCVVPFALLRTRRFVRRAHVINTELREAAGVATGELNEGVRGMTIVRRFGRRDDQLHRFARLNGRRMDTAERSFRLAARFAAEVDALGVLAYVPILVVGGFLLSHDQVTAGTIVGFVVFVGSFFDPLQTLTHLLAQAQAASGAYGRITRLLTERPNPPEPSDPRPLPPTGDLALEDVTFGYTPDAPPLVDGVTLRLPAGSRVALVGASGAGKTTVARLLARSFVPDRGRVTFGGVDLADVGRRDLRSRIVTVTQEGHLFDGTIRTNLGLTGASDVEVARMAERLEAAGLGSTAGTVDSRVSSGRRQLVALGRAMLADPAVLILDEATADVDVDAARAIDDLLAELPSERTVVVVVHRLETALCMDRVLVIDDGRVVEDGAPGDLAGGDGQFRRLLDRRTTPLHHHTLTFHRNPASGTTRPNLTGAPDDRSEHSLDRGDTRRRCDTRSPGDARNPRDRRHHNADR